MTYPIDARVRIWKYGNSNDPVDYPVGRTGRILSNTGENDYSRYEVEISEDERMEISYAEDNSWLCHEDELELL